MSAILLYPEYAVAPLTLSVPIQINPKSCTRVTREEVIRGAVYLLRCLGFVIGSQIPHDYRIRFAITACHLVGKICQWIDPEAAKFLCHLNTQVNIIG